MLPDILLDLAPNVESYWTQVSDAFPVALLLLCTVCAGFVLLFYCFVVLFCLFRSGWA